jgi:hypothetical protein
MKIKLLLEAVMDVILVCLLVYISSYGLLVQHL